MTQRYTRRTITPTASGASRQPRHRYLHPPQVYYVPKVASGQPAFTQEQVRKLEEAALQSHAALTAALSPFELAAQGASQGKQGQLRRAAIDAVEDQLRTQMDIASSPNPHVTRLRAHLALIAHLALREGRRLFTAQEVTELTAAARKGGAADLLKAMIRHKGRVDAAPSAARNAWRRILTELQDQRRDEAIAGRPVSPFVEMLRRRSAESAPVTRVTVPRSGEGGAP